MRTYTFSLFATLMLCASCSWLDNEKPIEKERRLMKELLGNDKSLFYKGLKISLRSLPLALDSTNKDSASIKLAQIRNSFMLFVTMQDPAYAAKQLNIAEYAAAAKEFSSIKEAITTTDEEQFPTIFEGMLNTAAGTPSAPPMLTWYNSTTEHLLLSALWMGTPSAPKEFQVYEAAAIDPSKIDPPLVKLTAEIGRALTFYDQEWFYMSEEECTNYLTDLEKAGPAIGKEMDFNLFPNATVNTPESRYHQLHAMGALMRGLDRQKIEKEDEALEDLETFLYDADKAGISDELVWLAGTYVSLKKEDNEKALEYLGKLEKSSILSKEELELIAEIKDYVSRREKDKAMNKIFDKTFIAKAGFHYIKGAMEKTSAYKQLQQHEKGRSIIEMPGKVSGTYGAMSTYLSTDSLGSKAENMVKDVKNIFE